MQEKKKLKDTLPLITRPKAETETWIVDKFPVKEDTSSEKFLAPVDLQLKVTPVRAKAKDLVSLQVQKFGDLLQEGWKPNEAARKLKTTVSKMLDKPQAQERCKKIIEAYDTNDRVRALLWKSMVNKGILENAEGEDADPKLLLDYLKLAAQDTSLGITAPQNVSVNIGIDPALKSLLAISEPIKELEAPLAAETEDLPKEEDK